MSDSEISSDFSNIIHKDDKNEDENDFSYDEDEDEDDINISKNDLTKINGYTTQKEIVDTIVNRVHNNLQELIGQFQESITIKLGNLENTIDKKLDNYLSSNDNNNDHVKTINNNLSEINNRNQFDSSTDDFLNRYVK
eukprot:jgi/Orpsp1_1/1178209/evm.model.c7180000064437.1